MSSRYTRKAIKEFGKAHGLTFAQCAIYERLLVDGMAIVTVGPDFFCCSSARGDRHWRLHTKTGSALVASGLLEESERVDDATAFRLRPDAHP